MVKVAAKTVQEHEVEGARGRKSNCKRILQAPYLMCLCVCKALNFSNRAGQALQTIPYGQTRTYKDIAAAIGRPSASRAVGAIGRNPVSIIVPCHRVLGVDGNLTGFAGGLDNKRLLLDLEQDHCPLV